MVGMMSQIVCHILKSSILCIEVKGAYSLLSKVIAVSGKGAICWIHSYYISHVIIVLGKFY